MCREFLGIRKLCVILAAGLILACWGSFAQAITLNWSTVGDPGNAADPTTTFGAVPYTYSITSFDITTGQYAAFLNAVAATDTYGLYTGGMSGMSSYFPTYYSANVGIVQNGTAGNFTYSTIGSPNVPVFDVSWGDAARLANWLQNGQPTNLGEAGGSTETGAYTLNGATTAPVLMGISRNTNAVYAIPNVNEWYKAAYYKGGGINTGYWLYATQNNSLPSNALSMTGTNNANFENPMPTDISSPLTTVGTFAASPGPYGTYDMNGDVYQWTEEVPSSGIRGVRGGSWGSTFAALPSSFDVGQDPTVQLPTEGIRLVMLTVPEPATWLLATCGAAGLWFARRRRR